MDCKLKLCKHRLSKESCTNVVSLFIQNEKPLLGFVICFKSVCVKSSSLKVDATFSYEYGIVAIV